MDLVSILSRQADYTRGSGFTVDIDKLFFWVIIKNSETNEEVFLQGNQAVEFIDEVAEVWREVEVLAEDIVELAVAKQYIDALC